MESNWSSLKNKFTQLPQNKFLLVLLASIVSYYLLKALAPNLNAYQSLIKMYAYAVGFGFELLSKLLNNNHFFDYDTLSVCTESLSVTVIPRLAVKFYLIVFVIIFAFPRKLKQSIVVFSMAAFALYLLGVSRFLIDMSNMAQTKHLFLPLVYSARYLVLYFVVRYKISLHKSLQSLVQRIDDKIADKFQFSFMSLLLILVASFAVMGVMDMFLVVQSQAIIDLLSNWIMWYSKQILFVLGYNPIVSGYQIEIGNYWVYLGTPCLGAGVMTMFAVLVTIIRSPAINKIFFVIIGINLLVFANAIRVVAILLHIYLNQIPQELIEDYHNMSNNFFYILVLIMIFVFVRWFKEISFKKTK